MKHIEEICFISYILGILMDWGYWIYYVDEMKNEPIIFPIILGWIPSLFWPLHLIYSFWDYIL